ncbi:MAG: hypothetical protein AAF356_10015 [Planctomycetota bacterium]
MAQSPRHKVTRLAGWLAFGLAAQTLVAWAIGFNPQGWRTKLPSVLVNDDNRVSAMFAAGQYSVVVVHGFAPLRNEFRIRYQDLGSADAAKAYVELFRSASTEVAEADPVYAGKRTVRDAPPGMQVHAPVDEVARIPIDTVLPGGSREIGRRDQLKIMTTGWPFRSCRMTWVERQDGTLDPFRGVLVDPAAVPRSWRSGASMYYPGNETLGAIPAYPMLTGTLGNTVVFGGVGLLAAWLTGLIRRRRRHSRGLCVSCGYDLGGSSTDASSLCPECGHASRAA